MSTKSRLLELLEQNRGKYLSGNELAKMLDVSRTAVWKGMKRLQQEGYSITAVTNKGYRWNEGQINFLRKEAVRLQLKNTEVLVEVWKEIASTNQRMKQLAVEKKASPRLCGGSSATNRGKRKKGKKILFAQR